MGKFEEYEKKLDLNSDKKRFWSKELTSFDDKTFCDSVHLSNFLYNLVEIPY